MAGLGNPEGATPTPLQQETPADNTPAKEDDPVKVRLNRPHHDRLSYLSKIYKIVQSRLGVSNLHPKEGNHSGAQYYSVKRDKISTDPTQRAPQETSQS